MMITPKAFLFDLNGTMIDDMNYHIAGWHKILSGLGANISMEQMKLECYGKNGELLERIFPGRFSENEKDVISIEKEKAYQTAFQPHLSLVNGLREFLDFYSDKGIKMAIGSAAIMFNINFVLDGLSIRKYFNAVVSADDVAYSKPHPETWIKAAQLLHTAPEDCLVFEDNPNGVEAARLAGMQAVVITTMHEPFEFAGRENIVNFKKDFSDMSIGGSGL